MTSSFSFRSFLLFFLGLTMLAACDGMEKETSYPERKELERNQARGKLTGDGLSLGGESDEEKAGNNPLGVNSFLWRATLDTLAFMPLASADPFGGVIITDWYEDPKARGERFKVTALILDRNLRADGVKVSLFKQQQQNGQWADVAVEDNLERELEDTILTRARQLKVKSLR
jgi:hypothetical protein